MKARQIERGQALVLIILAIVAIFGFAALAVDVGRLLAERRHAQGASDSAAMAAAFASTGQGGTTDPVVAITSALAENEYSGWTWLQDTAATSSDRLVVHYNHPPLSGPYIGNTEYYQVIMDISVDQVFSQFVYRGPLRVSVESVARAMPTSPVTPGAAIFANGRDNCPGIVWNGGMITTVTGGGIYSNSNGTGPGNCFSGITGGSAGTINVSGGSINLVGQWRNNGGATVNPTPVASATPFNLSLIPKPDCTHFSNGVFDNPTNTYNPGNYPSGISIHNGIYHFMPGMYCLNGNFNITGGIVTGEDVMFVMNGGGINFAGGATITFLRAHELEDSIGQQFGGMLIYMPVDNKNGLDISGNNGTTYAGTIYAPGPRDPASQEKCNFGGANLSIGLNSNIICYSIGIAGNSNVNIAFDANQNYQLQPRVELAQ